MPRQALVAAIERGVRDLGQVLPAGAAERLATLLVELERWNRRINLTAIRDLEAMVSGHVLDSLAARPFVEGPTVADIGSGPGFPGLPLAIAEPARAFELVEANGRKVAFVRQMISRLQVGNARSIAARVESYAPRSPFDTVIARALGSLSYLVEIAGHLVGDRGVLLALKGQYPHDELEQLQAMRALTARWDCRVERIAVPGLAGHARHVVSLRRRAEGGA